MSKLLYLDDFNVETCTGTVLSLNGTEDGRVDIVLDQTCFYPRGGGQDWDGGVMRSGTSEFTVEEVRLDENGEVHHIGGYRSGEFVVGDEVTCEVDHERRSVNTRLHSGGHVIDMAIDALGFDWVATKGQHYPHLSAVEYQGTWDPEAAEELRQAIEAKANSFVEQELENTLKFMSVDEMSSVCRHVPENIPTNKPARVVIYGDRFGIPCGGTHVKNLREIGTITVPKLKEKKGVIRVNYAVEGIEA